MGYFIELPYVTDQGALRQIFYDSMAEAFPGWQPFEADVEVWIARWFAQVAADLAATAGLVAQEVFSQFGQRIVGVPAIGPTQATAQTTWVMTDDAGYAIPAGVNIAIPKSDSEWVGFQTTDEVLVAPGDTATAAGEVLVRAILPGEAANGLVDTPSLIDAFAFVDHIVLEGVTAGGTDAETGDAFVERLAGELTTLSDDPILPHDVEILARKTPSVGRALALDGYNPDDDTWDNERMVAVAVATATGQACSAPAKAAVDAYLQARRETNFVFNVIDPTFTIIDVDAGFVALPSYDGAEVANRVAAALTDYFNPAKWGVPSIPGRSPLDWVRVTVVRRTELEALVNSVLGVDYVPDGAVTLAVQGDTLDTDDVTLDGVAPLTQPGDIEAHT
jgi:hypothetical protein